MESTGNSITILVVRCFLLILETRLVRVLSKCSCCLGERCAQVDGAWRSLCLPLSRAAAPCSLLQGGRCRSPDGFTTRTPSPWEVWKLGRRSTARRGACVYGRQAAIVRPEGASEPHFPWVPGASTCTISTITRPVNAAPGNAGQEEGDSQREQLLP